MDRNVYYFVNVAFYWLPLWNSIVT